MSRNPQPYLHDHLVVVIDCNDLDRSAQFCTSVLGYVRDGPPGGPYQGLVPADGQGIEILLQQVPEIKNRKNRLHLDLRTADLYAEAGRVVALGALRLTSTPMMEGDWRWHILADPDGNEFCILQPPASYRSGHQRASEPTDCYAPAAEADVAMAGPPTDDHAGWEDGCTPHTGSHRHALVPTGHA